MYNFFRGSSICLDTPSSFSVWTNTAKMSIPDNLNSSQGLLAGHIFSYFFYLDICSVRFPKRTINNQQKLCPSCSVYTPPSPRFFPFLWLKFLFSFLTNTNSERSWSRLCVSARGRVSDDLTDGLHLQIHPLFNCGTFGHAQEITGEERNVYSAL